MYAYFKGILVQKKTDSIILEVNSIGYNIFMPVGKIAILPSVGSEVCIYTYTSVREDALELYGFEKVEELDLFKKLITVSGIGPRSALGMISALTVKDIVTAIVTDDVKTLSSTPGIGKKTAERLIIDLKDKVSADFDTYDIADNTGTLNSGKLSSGQDEAVLALTALGYGQKEALKAVIEASSDCETDDPAVLIKKSLRYL